MRDRIYFPREKNYFPMDNIYEVKEEDLNEKSHLCLKKSSSWQKSGQKNSYRKLISSFLVSTRSKSLLGNFLWWRISARSQGGAGFCFAKTSAPPFDLASILHHKKFPAAFRPCTNQETQKYLF